MNISLENELWLIYSHYTLLSDPNQLEQMKIQSFGKFAKDCQIMSNNLKSVAIELEIARLVRAKRSNEKQDYNATVSIGFTDFLNLIGVLAQKVYHDAAPDVAVRRLLLENIFLLACRRVPIPLPKDDEDYPKAIHFLKDTFGRSLRNIYEYYLELSESRRNQLMAQDISKKYKTIDKLSYASVNRQQLVSNKDQIKHFKGLMTYKEYNQFCQDFNLKSTALLTAMQIADVYLNCVPLDSEMRIMKGMSFELFCETIVHMGFVAYRDYPEAVSLFNKTKALLLFMWKQVNARDKATAFAQSRMTMPVSHAGSLNIYGSGAFSDQFLHIWQSEGFPDYACVAQEETKETGLELLRRITSMPHSEEETQQEIKIEENDSNIPLQNANDPSIEMKQSGSITIKATDLAKLVKENPEIGEYLFTEIQKLGSSR